MLKIDPKMLWTKELVEDMGTNATAYKPTKIYWREKPKLFKTDNGIYAVRMRAAFL